MKFNIRNFYFKYIKQKKRILRHLKKKFSSSCSDYIKKCFFSQYNFVEIKKLNAQILKSMNLFFFVFVFVLNLKNIIKSQTIKIILPLFFCLNKFFNFCYMKEEKGNLSSIVNCRRSRSRLIYCCHLFDSCTRQCSLDWM